MNHKACWTEQKIATRLELLERMAFRRRSQLEPFRFRELYGPTEIPPFGAATSEWDVIEPHSFWGPPRTDFLLKTIFQIPSDWQNASLLLPLGISGAFSHPEALIYLDGTPYAGCDRHHQEIELPDELLDGGEHRLALHGWTGLGSDWRWTDPNHRLQMSPCYLVEVCTLTRELAALTRVCLGLAKVLEENDPAKGRLLNGLHHAFLALDTREPLQEAFYESVPAALKLLYDEFESAGVPLNAEVYCTGHAHIDIAWLWPVSQARQKAARTFHTVDYLMERFPDYHFSQSQPQLYDYLRSDYPNLFERVKQRVREGRWEVLGGMWVEADANLTGAESLVRQMLYGRRFFKQHFGDVESPVLWLPDVFGYSWSLPQLMKQAGLEYFFTIKIGWNQYNRLPYDSFWWQGIDGTRVLTHFSTSPDPRGARASTYNSVATAEQVVGTWRNFQQKETQNVLLMAYGYGDGGGGPTREMLENIERLHSAPSAPRAVSGTVKQFFEEMEKRCGHELPVWNGELYLEYHRGTYTTQGATKRGNRKCEAALHSLEFLAVWAEILNPEYRCPRDRLAQCWKTVLLNQFHDILPGSSIREVYQEAELDYTRVLECTEELQDEALGALAESLSGELLLFNPTSWGRREPISVADLHNDTRGRRWVDFQGRPVFQQGELLMPTAEIPSYGVLPLHTEPGEPPEYPYPVRVGADGLENRYLKVEMDKRGRLVSLWDKTDQRELLPTGAWANQLQLFEDRPMQWDAWDIDIYYEDRCQTLDADDAVEVVEEGPLRGAVRVCYSFGDSRIEQTISLHCESSRLDFHTKVEWRERHTLLKAAFPVQILAPNAAYEIPWGHVTRPVHRNTSWDWARFECPAHKWVDLSEGDYGVSLLNDCKYGHDVSDGQLRITLLRSPTSPDPEADQGPHEFTYSLFPHSGALGTETIREAYFLNFPVVYYGGTGKAGEARSLVSVEPEQLVIETVKPTEDGEGWVLRCYESLRTRGRGEFRLSGSATKVETVNLLEETAESVPLNQGGWSRDFTPFQIQSFRVS